MKKVLISSFLFLSFVVGGCTTASTPTEVEVSPTQQISPTESTEDQEPEPTEVSISEEIDPFADAKWASRPFVYASCCDFPNQIDPHLAIDFPGSQPVFLVYEALINYEGSSTNLIPALATAWEISEDGTEYTFKLREGVEFHDGSDFDAEDVKFSYERIRDQNLGVATYQGSFDHVEIDDQYTVRVILSEPDANFKWTIPFYKIVDSGVMEHEIDGDMGIEYLSENMIGTGPYMVTRIERPNSIQFTANPDYWGGWDGPHFKGVVFRYGLDMSTRVLQLEEGSLDMMGDVPSEEAERLNTDPNVNIHTARVPRMAFYSMNTQSGPLADLNVRRAVQLAFPYEEVLNLFPEGFAYTIRGGLPEGLEEHDTSVFEPWSQNLEEAKQILEQAGYEEDEITITLAVIADFAVETLPAQLLQEALAEIGVELIIEPIPWATLSSAMSSPDTAYDMGALLLEATTPFPGNYLHQEGHSSAAGATWNWAYYQKPEFDELLGAAASSPDSEERTRLLTEAHQMIVGDAAYIYEFGMGTFMGLRSDVKGYVYPTWSYLRVADVYNYWLEE